MHSTAPWPAPRRGGRANDPFLRPSPRPGPFPSRAASFPGTDRPPRRGPRPARDSKPKLRIAATRGSSRSIHGCGPWPLASGDSVRTSRDPLAECSFSPSCGPRESNPKRPASRDPLACRSGVSPGPIRAPLRASGPKLGIGAPIALRIPPVAVRCPLLPLSGMARIIPGRLRVACGIGTSCHRSRWPCVGRRRAPRLAYRKAAGASLVRRPFLRSSKVSSLALWSGRNSAAMRRRRSRSSLWICG